MKALSLTQPWASLVAIQAKRIETRSWYTAYRGPLAIHAAKGFPAYAKDLATCRRVLDLMRPFVKDDRDYLKQIPLGVVVATCNLTACTRITPALTALLSEQEQDFGNYEPGRFAWSLEDIIMLPEPIPAKGALSLWEWEQPK